MSDDPKITRDRAHWRELLESPAKIAILPIAIVLLAAFAYAIEHMLWESLEDNKLAFLSAIFSVFAIAIISAVTANYFFNALATSKAANEQAANTRECKIALAFWQERRDEAIHELDAAKSKLQQERNAIEAERVAFETKCEQVRKSLDEQEAHFRKLVDSQHNWLYHNEEILQLEKETDFEILVLAPDFYYEQQREYEDAIADNLLKPIAPAYEYFIAKSSQNEGALQNLRQRLEHKLRGHGCATAAETVNSRFRVHLIPDDEFPHCVGYGLAIYRFKNQDKNRCLIYWPKEIGSWNLDILAAGKQGDGKKIVDAITTHLQGLAKKYTVC